MEDVSRFRSGFIGKREDGGGQGEESNVRFGNAMLFEEEWGEECGNGGEEDGYDFASFGELVEDFASNGGWFCTWLLFVMVVVIMGMVVVVRMGMAHVHAEVALCHPAAWSRSRYCTASNGTFLLETVVSCKGRSRSTHWSCSSSPQHRHDWRLESQHVLKEEIPFSSSPLL